MIPLLVKWRFFATYDLENEVKALGLAAAKGTGNQAITHTTGLLVK